MTIDQIKTIIHNTVENSGYITGTVESAAPLSIRLSSKITVGKESLETTKLCRQLKKTIATQAVTFWENLKKGDIVILLKSCDGRRYIVLDVLEGV